MARVTRCEVPGIGRRIEAAVHQAGRRAREAVRAAEAEALRLREEAEADRARLSREAAEAGLAEGRARAAGALAGAAAARDALLAGAVREVASLAVEVARRIVARELALGPELVLAIAERAVGEVRARREVTVRVAPADLARLRAGEPRLAAVLERGLLAVREDGSLAAGDVVVETEAGRVDARIDAQLGAFARAIEEATP